MSLNTAKPAEATDDGRHAPTTGSAVANSALETELKEFIIRALCLEDITVDDIPSDMVLFGEGLGLDSVDALELAIALQKTYEVTLDSKEEKTIYYLTCVRNLAELISEQRASA